MATARRITLAAGATPLNADDPQCQLFVTNTGANPVDLGDDTVTAGQGYPLAAGASLPDAIDTDSVMYAIGTQGQTVAIIVS
jgi:hypothetical protein